MELVVSLSDDVPELEVLLKWGIQFPRLGDPGKVALTKLHNGVVFRGTMAGSLAELWQRTILVAFNTCFENQPLEEDCMLFDAGVCHARRTLLERYLSMCRARRPQTSFSIPHRPASWKLKSVSELV